MVDRAPPGVLVVDDQADICALLQTILRHHGFTVWLAPGGAEAVQLYGQQRDRVDLVLLDVDMPDWDGPRTFKTLRRINPDLCVCYVSGAGVDYTDDELIATGAARIIHRPFDAAQVAKVLWELVGTGHGNRRANDRRYPKQATRVSVGAGLAPTHVVESWVCDQSPGGLRLKSQFKLGDTGALLSIRPADAPEDSPWVPVQVRHSSRDEDGWAIGCQFLHPAAKRVFGE
jgi:two-component system, OmpR family, response regulator